MENLSIVGWMLSGFIGLMVILAISCVTTYIIRRH